MQETFDHLSLSVALCELFSNGSVRTILLVNDWTMTGSFVCASSVESVRSPMPEGLFGAVGPKLLTLEVFGFQI